jgi:hypothetical protein
LRKKRETLHLWNYTRGIYQDFPNLVYSSCIVTAYTLLHIVSEVDLLDVENWRNDELIKMLRCYAYDGNDEIYQPTL